MANGADVKFVNIYNITIFSFACAYRSPSFLQELADKVTPDHLSMPNRNGSSPMQIAVQCNPDYLPIVRMLILPGAPVRPDDFPASSDDFGDSLLDERRNLLASLEADLRLNDQILIGLFFCGANAPMTDTEVTPPTKCARTAAEAENHLSKLRGFRNSEVRMAIAGFLGVRPAAELGPLRAARDVLVALA